MAIYSTVVAFAELRWMNVPKDSFARNLFQMHSLLGFALSLLLVFRTNTAYDRWWEGRKLWGSLVNNSRNLAIKLHSILPDSDKDSREFFRRTIPLYATILKKHLQSPATIYALDEKDHPEFYLDTKKHAPNQVAMLLHNRVLELHRKGSISAEQLIFLNPELTSFTDICGACERIKNTPIPYSYSAFIKKFIFIYVMTLPFGYVFSLGFYIIPVVSLVFYILASLEVIAEEIEDPFGSDQNDLPMQKMAENIGKHVSEILN
jgi:putative membrane protein